MNDGNIDDCQNRTKQKKEGKYTSLRLVSMSRLCELNVYFATREAASVGINLRRNQLLLIVNKFHYSVENNYHYY